eukprot:CAMPEP_0204897380 /NCGR_PEP_ID=MMETSP1397-20131031/701_1 /ASSEMBLY_ACC=CAM_ASM_000891 /TAXON_ID=49980 /ORGANISM="Climacostomum Climacostomum virens, Strain Stock W-24" /LENGTH=449 /DNA_ID=CAMNT_0052065117 /DNA_START=75 /DNA_END=1424 /DNA_ORIENTATION=-
MPEFSEKPGQVRLNAAAILREEARLKKQEQAERKKIEALVVDMRDASEFERWQADMKARDEIENMEQFQLRKLEMELAREEAIKAQKAKLQENFVTALKLKEESREQAEKRDKAEAQLLEDKRKVAEQIYDERANIAVERDKVVEQKKKLKEELQAEINEAVARRKEEELVENAKRDELIRQIREIQKQPVKRNKGFDPTEVMGFGLLEEMSLAQLWEKLDEVKKERDEAVSRKREENLKKKEEKNTELLGKVSKIQEMRAKQIKFNEEKRKHKIDEKERKERLMQQAREKGLLSVHEKIGEKKKAKRLEQEKLAKELKEIQLKRQYLQANRALVEEKAWKELEVGVERRAKNEQDERLLVQERIERVKLAETQLRAKAASDTIRAKTEILDIFDANYTEAKLANEHLQEMTDLENATKVDRQREFTNLHIENMRERNPYASKVTMHNS